MFTTGLVISVSSSSQTNTRKKLKTRKTWLMPNLCAYKEKLMQPIKRQLNYSRLVLLLSFGFPLLISGCQTASPQLNLLPNLPAPPAVVMPPRSSVILGNVESDIKKWEASQQERLTRHGLTEKPGPASVAKP